MGGVERAAGTLAGDAYADLDPVQSAFNPQRYVPGAARPSLCHVLPYLLPFPGQAPGEGCRRSQPAGAFLRAGGTGTGTPLACRLLGPTVHSHGVVGSSFRGSERRGGGLWEQQPISPAVRRPRSGGASLQPRRLSAPL